MRAAAAAAPNAPSPAVRMTPRCGPTINERRTKTWIPTTMPAKMSAPGAPVDMPAENAAGTATAHVCTVAASWVSSKSHAWISVDQRGSSARRCEAKFGPGNGDVAHTRCLLDSAQHGSNVWSCRASGGDAKRGRRPR